VPNLLSIKSEELDGEKMKVKMKPLDVRIVFKQRKKKQATAMHS